MQSTPIRVDPLQLTRKCRLSTRTQWPRRILAFCQSSYGHIQQRNASLASPHPGQISKDPREWTKLLAPHLPDGFKSDGGPSVPGFQYSRPRSLGDVILQARRSADIDVLSHVGFVEGRWNAMLWIIDKLLHVEGSINPVRSGDLPVNNIQWTKLKSLDELTFSSPPFDTSHPDYQWNATISNTKQAPLGLQTLSSVSTTHFLRSDYSRLVLGQVWQSLGSLILKATDRTENESMEIMSVVLLVIAKMHRMGFIPHEIYQSGSPLQGSFAMKPEIFDMLSSEIIATLIDNTTEVSGEIEGIEIPEQLESEKYYMAARLPPRLWLEYVLWCCVHGGWIKEALGVITELRTYSGRKKWSLFSWHLLAKDPKEGVRLFLQRLDHSKSSGNTALIPRDGNIVRDLHLPYSSERSISTEVIVTLANSLVDIIPEQSQAGVTHQEVHEHIRLLKVLRNALEADRMSLGVTSWDELICRIADISDMPMLESPRTMESLLELAQPLGREADSKNVSPFIPKWIFEGNANVVNLYHRLLCAYVLQKDVEGALRTLVRLTEFTDKNKTKSLRDFVELVRKSNLRHGVKGSLVGDLEVRPKDMPEDSVTPRRAGILPEIPIQLLQLLLDLMTESGQHNFAQWMLYSDTVEGSMIPPSLYSNQIMAPAIVRHAIAISDNDLVAKVFSQQVVSQIGLETFLSVCQARIKQGKWEDVQHILKMIRQHTSITWEPENLASLLRYILPSLATEKESENHYQAMRMTQRILRGDIGQLGADRLGELDSMTAVIASAHPVLRNICSEATRGGRLVSLRLRTRTFSELLYGVSLAFGSECGKRLWTTWCSPVSQMRGILVSDEPEGVSSSSTSSQAVQSLGERFSLTEDSDRLFQAEPWMLYVKGSVPKQIQNLLTIIRCALRELRHNTDPEGLHNSDTAFNTDDAEAAGGKGADSLKPSMHAQVDSLTGEATDDEQHPVLEWAVQELQDMGIGHSEILTLTEGYGRAKWGEVQDDIHTQPVQASYSDRTISTWRTLSRRNIIRTSTYEEDMRRFASDSRQSRTEIWPLAASERFFLISLARDMGMRASAFGASEPKSVMVEKSVDKPRVPLLRLAEVTRERTRA